MPAPKGNKYAEKWNQETVLSKIDHIIEHFNKNKDNYHFGLALVECDVYPEWWAKMKDKFADNNEVCQAIKKVELKFESRIINSTLKGDAKSAAMSIFYLKNKHGYKDKTERDHTSDGKPINILNLGAGIEPNKETE